MVASRSNWENPSAGYDHHITASTFQRFFGVFPPDPTGALAPG